MTLLIGAPKIESLSYKPLTTQEASTPGFTLICTSTGGPASTVTWTKDCTPVPNDVNHLQSQTLLDGDTGTYQSVLTVTEIFWQLTQTKGCLLKYLKINTQLQMSVVESWIQI